MVAAARRPHDSAHLRQFAVEYGSSLRLVPLDADDGAFIEVSVVSVLPRTGWRCAVTCRSPHIVPL